MKAIDWLSARISNGSNGVGRWECRFAGTSAIAFGKFEARCRAAGLHE